ncbi:MAG TPA: hypothetical protein VGQ15_06675 [Gaiellaceae bacterium]|nr:hypothetical protein [Gaiellaceae bacterium]
MNETAQGMSCGPEDPRTRDCYERYQGEHEEDELDRSVPAVG